MYKDVVFEFLDDLRERGGTNMYGAKPYILSEFPMMPVETAKELLLEWMHTFEERHPVDRRLEEPNGGIK
jgi:hypothetical protein